ncbi:hypothetical protein D1122_21100 [Cereibacter sphaeroides]|uniref:phage tail assembly chaperone n=1 Tax=Cereibacter sphaeroides TaxID=1063 RepID=UPI000E5BC99C|nr:phage tail assembly chaperone [Cereibacter sphaeroides]RHZ91526.1 hypothetical protein D1122_21100 [Cereibacter sphaeroides]
MIVRIDPERKRAIQAERARAERDRRLAETDWRTAPDRPDAAAWAAYRQALRDVPEQPGFPAEIFWPEPPAA